MLLVFLFFSITFVNAQKNWNTIQQKDYGITYNLPKNWEVDNFGYSENWEEGSSVCQCAGTINGTNTFENKIKMVIYPINLKDTTEINKRNKVWDLEFIPSLQKKNNIKINDFIFEKTIGSWTEKNAGEFKGNEVWKYKVISKQQMYYI